MPPTICPGTAPAPSEPATTTPGITVTPNVPQPIYSSNGVGDPLVSWNPTDEFCSLQFTATPGNQLVVPSTQWTVQWLNQDLTLGNDAGGNPALAAGFGVAPGSGTPVTGPASSTVAIGTNTLTVQILSGTIRVSMPNGSPFGYEPGDPVSNAVIKYTWASPVHALEHLYFDNGSDQTPKGLTNYQLSLASNAPPAPTAACSGAGAVTATTATLNGSYGNADPSDKVDVLWGTTPGGPYPSNAGQTAVLPAGSGPVSAPATGLLPNTTYYFVVRVYASDGTTVLAQSAECQFTTAAAPPPPLAVLSLQCGNEPTGAYTATLKGTLTAGGTGGSVFIRWTDGTNVYTSPPQPVTGTLPQSIQASLENLPPCITFESRAVWTNGVDEVVSEPCFWHVSGYQLKGACSA